jgi:hypothetical protein
MLRVSQHWVGKRLVIKRQRAGLWVSHRWVCHRWVSHRWVCHRWVCHRWVSHRWVSHRWVSHRWVSHRWVSHRWVSHRWVSHRWVSHRWVSQHPAAKRQRAPRWANPRSVDTAKLEQRTRQKARSMTLLPRLIVRPPLTPRSLSPQILGCLTPSPKADFHKHRARPRRSVARAM